MQQKTRTFTVTVTETSDQPADTEQVAAAAVVAPIQVGNTAQPAGEEEPVCVHGTRHHRTGVSKTGKPYAAWFCGADKNTPNRCEPIWGKK